MDLLYNSLTYLAMFLYAHRIIWLVWCICAAWDHLCKLRTGRLPAGRARQVQGSKQGMYAPISMQLAQQTTAMACSTCCAYGGAIDTFELTSQMGHKLMKALLFMITTWISTGLRVHVRTSLIKSFGADDVFAVLTLVRNISSVRRARLTGALAGCFLDIQRCAIHAR